MINYYDILGVAPDASTEEVNDAYTFQVKVFHPDKYDPTTHPAQHARALKMTQRLNEARDTLLDPTTRARHDRELSSGGPMYTAPPPPPPSARPTKRPSRRTLVAWAVAGLIIATTGLTLAVPDKPSGRTLTARATPTPIPCPSGSPTVSVAHVDILPDPDAYMPDERQNRRLYIVTGTILNNTSLPVVASELGFYLGSSSTDAPPQWSQSLATMDVEGDINDIQPGVALSWKSKYVVDWPMAEKGAHPANVTATLEFPYSTTSKLEPQWMWSDIDSRCL